MLRPTAARRLLKRSHRVGSVVEAGPSGAPRPGPLTGIRILELGGGQPGAYACWLLAELGADVLVVAPRGVSDELSAPGSLAVGAGKRRLLLDRSHPQARTIAVGLARVRDALVSSIPESIAIDLGLGAGELRAAAPRLVYGQASADGPLLADREAPLSDIVAQAAGGLMWKTGVEGAPPTAAGAALGEHSAGAYLAAAVLGGLAQVALTGRGSRTDVSLTGAQIALQSWEIGSQSVLERDTGRAGVGHPDVSPRAIWGAFEAADGWLVLGSVDAARFERLCALMELPELHERYPDDARRAEGIADITDRLSSRFRERRCAHWLDLFAEFDVMGSRVQDYDDVLTDEQAWANGYLRAVTHPARGAITVVGSPIQLDGAGQATGTAPAPMEGATASALAELGYDGAAVERLLAAGVVA